jgi:DNA-binding winged helix-turn-helix (wHTH) protein
MATQPQSPARLAFGPFEVNSQAGELLKSGVHVRLSGQPFQILLVLLAHPGDAVTRDRLCQQIWGDETFVDFEHGLNAAMNKVRRALGDSAENPRYIETVPGRGYRFIGAMERRLPAPVPSSSPVPNSGPIRVYSRRPPHAALLLACTALIAAAVCRRNAPPSA